MKRKVDTCRFCANREMIENDTGTNKEAQYIGWCAELDKQAPRKAEACDEFSKAIDSSQRRGR